MPSLIIIKFHLKKIMNKNKVAYNFFLLLFLVSLAPPVSNARSILNPYHSVPHPRILQEAVTEFQINSNDPGIDPKARVTSFGQGFVVVWQALRTGSNSQDILIKTFDNTGKTIQGPFSIDPTAKTNQTNPKFFQLSNGTSILVWIGFNSTTGKTANYFQLFNSSGSPSGSIKLNENSSFSEWDQADAFAGSLSNGGFVFSWANQTTVWFQRYYANGTSAGQPQMAFDPEDYPRKPSVIGLNNGFFVVLAFFGDDLVGRMFTASGVLYKNSFSITTVSPVASPSLKSTPEGFLVLYTGMNTTTGFQDIYGQFFDYEANALGNEQAMDTAIYGDDVNPFLTVLKDNCMILSFETNSDSSNSKSIYLKKYAQNMELIADDVN